MFTIIACVMGVYNGCMGGVVGRCIFAFAECLVCLFVKALLNGIPLLVGNERKN